MKNDKEFLIKKAVVIMMMITNMFLTTSCWDYAEISDLIPIAGIAVDKDVNSDEYVLTLEVIQPSEAGGSVRAIILEGRGRTLHEAFRETITTTGSMIGASHAVVYIVDRNIAKEGMLPVIDLVDRDVEVRSDMLIFVADEESAGEVFKKTKDLGEIISYQLASSIGSQKKSGRFIDTKLYEFVDELAREGISPSVANIHVGHTDKDIVAKVEGTHVFKGDKAIGKLDGNETFFLSFLKEDIDLNTVIPVKLEDGTKVTLEMIDYHKKMRPHWENDEICFDVIIDINTTISEIIKRDYDKNYIAKKERYMIKTKAEDYVRNNIYELIEKAQNDFEVDIFGFGEIIKKKRPDVWKTFQGKWNDEFKRLKVYVKCNVHIRGSSLLKDSIKVVE